jgi:hypothetical protein
VTPSFQAAAAAAAAAAEEEEEEEATSAAAAVSTAKQDKRHFLKTLQKISTKKWNTTHV